MLVTVEFRRVDKETELVLTHERLPDDEARRRHTGGSTSIVDKLGAHFTSTSVC